MGEISKLSSPSSNDNILRQQSPLTPEIRSFEKLYIGCVKTTVNKFFVSGPKYTRLHCHLA